MDSTDNGFRNEINCFQDNTHMPIHKSRLDCIFLINLFKSEANAKFQLTNIYCLVVIILINLRTQYFVIMISNVHGTNCYISN